jgi:hypothetical protein
MTEQECIERVMSAHWDMVACPCGACQYGRKKGWAARSMYLCSLEPGAIGEGIEPPSQCNAEEKR